MSDIAIKIEHLSKMYRLGIINNGALFQDIQTWIALKLGKNDPHSKIGENKYAGDKDHFWALKDISLDIKQGDRVGIIGKNGAGKSTLLKILSRITTPTEGAIKIKGKIASLLEVGTGFHGELTGRENIYLNGAILGMKKRRITEKLDSIIDFSGIEQHIDTPVKRYSSGMYVRLAFAVAAHLDSDILIADEVLAVGDAEFQKKALGKMQDLSAGEGRTVLFVSHNMAAVKQLCNSGIFLFQGKVASEGDLQKIISKYNGLSESKLVVVSHWNNHNNFVSPFFTPISLAITNNSAELSSNVTINFLFKFEIKQINNLLDFCFIVRSDTTQIFASSPYEEVADYKPHVGLNILEMIIPKKLFNDNYYILEVQASIHKTEFIINNLDENSPRIIFKINRFIHQHFTDSVNKSLILPPVTYYVK